MGDKRLAFQALKALSTRTVWHVTEHAVKQAKTRCQPLADADEFDLRLQIDEAMRETWEKGSQVPDPSADRPTWLVEWHPHEIDAVLYVVCVTNDHPGPYFGLPCAVTVLSQAQGHAAVERARWRGYLKVEADEERADATEGATSQQFPASDSAGRVVTYPRYGKPPATLLVKEGELEAKLLELLEAGVRLSEVLVWSPAHVTSRVQFQVAGSPH